MKIPLLLGAIALGSTGLGAIGALAHGANHNPTRHRYLMRNEKPAICAEVINPLQGNRADLFDGEALYNDNCANCHGTEGRGQTDVAEDLDPTQASLTELFARQMSGMGRGGDEGHLMHRMNTPSSEHGALSRLWAA